MTERRGMTPEDIYALPSIEHAAISPDGQLIAYVLRWADREKDENTSQIWMVASHGADAVQITRGTRDTAPEWSPDSRSLAFISARGDKAVPQVYLIPRDGGE